MSYRHIPNLYKDKRILMFKRCFAMEKIHGTSAHVSWKDGKLTFFSGGAAHDSFVALFNQETLVEAFEKRECPDVTVYGEAYGGKMQKMSETYGDQLRFIAFEVKIDDVWLDVPKAHTFATYLGLEFVEYVEVSTDLDVLDTLRDSMSAQAKRNGCGEKKREGIVLRPPIEVRLNNGERLLAKHKNETFSERKHTPKVGVALEVLQEAEKIADEWVVPERIRHVADALGLKIGVENIGPLIKGVRADMAREAAGEIVVNDATWKAIAKQTAVTVKGMCVAALRESK